MMGHTRSDDERHELIVRRQSTDPRLARVDIGVAIALLGSFAIVVVVLLCIHPEAIIDTRQVWCCDDADGRTYTAIEPWTRWTRWTEAGWIWTIEPEVRARPDGAWAQWSSDGRLDIAVSGFFVSGQRDRTFDATADSRIVSSRPPIWVTGLVQIESDNAGYPIGRWKAWWPNGQERGEEDADMPRENHVVFWHDNGQKEYEGDVEISDAAGIWSYWYPNGQLRAEVDHMSYLATTWNDDGTRTATDAMSLEGYQSMKFPIEDPSRYVDSLPEPGHVARGKTQSEKLAEIHVR